MSVLASQITSLAIVYSTVYLGKDQRKHQSSASLAFVVRGIIHRSQVNSPHKGPVTQKMFPFDNVIMNPNVTIFYLVIAGFLHGIPLYVVSILLSYVKGRSFRWYTLLIKVVYICETSFFRFTISVGCQFVHYRHHPRTHSLKTSPARNNGCW